MHDWYIENQLIASHLPIGTQLQMIGTAYELETGKISRTEALTMATYYAAVSFAHLYMGIVAVEHMQRVQGLYADIPAPLAKRIEKVAFGSTLRTASKLIAAATFVEMAITWRQLVVPGATSYTRVHYGGVRSFHAVPRLYL
jgi:hypothetical protein